MIHLRYCMHDWWRARPRPFLDLCQNACIMLCNHTSLIHNGTRRWPEPAPPDHTLAISQRVNNLFSLIFATKRAKRHSMSCQTAIPHP